MPYTKVSDAPANIRKLDGVALTLAQVNWIANVADGLDPDQVESVWAVAIAQFKRSFRKEGGKWVKRKQAETKEIYHMGRFAQFLEFLRGEDAIDENDLALEMKDQDYKTEGGVRYRRSDYAVRGEADKPTTWKLRLAEGSSGNFTVVQVARAITAMQPSGFRGRRVQLEPGEKTEAVRNINAAIAKVGDSEQKKTLRERLAKVKALSVFEKALSLGDIRGGIYERIAPESPVPIATDEHPWVKDVYPDGNTGSAIIQKGKRLFRVDYTIGEEDSLTLGQAEEVKVTYEAKTKAIDLATFKGGFKAFEHDGKDYWLTFTANAFKDKEEEVFTTKALGEYVAEVDKGIPAEIKALLEKIGLPSTDQGELWLAHIPGSRIGAPMWKGVEDRFLIEVGLFDDTELGKAAAAHFKECGDDYRTSHGYLYHPGDKEKGIYHWLWKFETSPLLAGWESNPWTGISIIAKEAKTMDDKKKAWLVETFGQKLADDILAKAQEASKSLEDLGITFKGEPPEGEPEPEPQPFILEKDSEALQLLADAVAEKLGLTDVKANMDKLAQALKEAGERIGTIEEGTKPLVVLSRGFRASQEASTEVDTKKVPEGAMPSGQHPLDEQYAKRRQT